jgi:hypothetical protein
MLCIFFKYLCVVNSFGRSFFLLLATADADASKNTCEPRSSKMDEVGERVLR